MAFLSMAIFMAVVWLLIHHRRLVQRLYLFVQLLVVVGQEVRISASPVEELNNTAP